MKKSVWWWIIGIIIVLLIMNYIDNKKEEECDLTFYTYTYNDGCANACTSKCYDEDFPHSSGYFNPYLSVEEMNNPDLYKRCECNCGGCRK